MNKRHKLFIAINLPRDIKKILTGYEKRWPELPARWVSQENLHITLVFLGDLTDVELGEVCVAVKEVMLKHNSFNISLAKVFYGPPGKIPPKMIWVEGKGSKELLFLKNDLQKHLLRIIRFAPEARIFSPHITLARIREWEWKKIEPEERPNVNETIDLTFSVESIEVMESELKRGGPQYTIIESHKLR